MFAVVVIGNCTVAVMSGHVRVAAQPTDTALGLGLGKQVDEVTLSRRPVCRGCGPCASPAAAVLDGRYRWSDSHDAKTRSTANIRFSVTKCMKKLVEYIFQDL